jgi:hypothetical protein
MMSSSLDSDSNKRPDSRKAEGIVRYLQPLEYQLCDDDVSCGRGHLCYNHIGNQRFRWLIEQNLTRYSKANSKYTKSLIIEEVIAMIQNQCNQKDGLGFVKKDETTGQYYKVSHYLALKKHHNHSVMPLSFKENRNRNNNKEQ